VWAGRISDSQGLGDGAKRGASHGANRGRAAGRRRVVTPVAPALAGPRRSLTDGVGRSTLHRLLSVGTPSPRHPAESLRFRRRVGALSTDQLATFRRAFADVMALPDTDDRGYQHWAGFHGLPGRIWCDVGHGRPEFLPWHRAYLYFFEQALRDRQRVLHNAADVMLAWWDWRRPTPNSEGRMPAAFTEETVDGKPNPLFSAPVNEVAIQQGAEQGGFEMPDHTVREPGRAVDQDGKQILLPSVDDVNWVLGFSDFTEFSSQLESLHGAVHMWVGGHMGEIPFAAYDPIFWAHHTMIDRIWRRWQLKHKGSNPPASILNEVMEPFKMTVADTLDPTIHGYDYMVATRSASMTPA
jgi:tyrosinase